MKTLNPIKTAAAAILMTGAAMAQSPMTANVPFDFQVGKVKFPAGEYRVDTSRTIESGLVTIQNAETKQAVVRIGLPESAGNGSGYQPRLVFRCGAESGCLLSQVWSPVLGSRFSLPKAAEHQYTASIPLSAPKAD